MVFIFDYSLCGNPSEILANPILMINYVETPLDYLKELYNILYKENNGSVYSSSTFAVLVEYMYQEFQYGCYNELPDKEKNYISNRGGSYNDMYSMRDFLDIFTNKYNIQI